MKHTDMAMTGDGSPTLLSPHHGAPYHSMYGALTESRHVFIDNGLEMAAPNTSPIRVLEVGFGTGLNAALTWDWAQRKSRSVHYIGIEPHRVPPETLSQLNYAQYCGMSEEAFQGLHPSAFHGAMVPSPDGRFTGEVVTSSCAQFFKQRKPGKDCDVVFYDAFSPKDQPEMWTESAFKEVRQCLKVGGILVTYCAKGEVRRAMEAAGFAVERLPGPPGKREMLRARNLPIERFNVRVYGILLDRPRERVLLAREQLGAFGEKVKFPGGGMEFGEGPLDALKREFREELGADVGLKNVAHFYTTDFFVRSAFRPEDQILSLYFTAQLDPPELETRWGHRFGRSGGEESGLAFKWRRIQDLNPADLHFPIDRHILAQICAIEPIKTSDDV